VANGLEVLKAVEHKPYDLVFLDVQMPEFDGFDTAREICRRWPRSKRPRLIAVTGAALTGDREKCIAAGMDDYICKPIRLAEIQAAIERWGPTRIREFDTATFFARQAVLAPEELLDRSLIEELRTIAPSEGMTMLAELVDLYLDAAPKRLAQLQDSLSEPAKLRLHAHSFKSMSMNLGARKVVELSQKLEDLARAGATQDAAAVLGELKVQFARTKDELLRVRDS
jgi:CheY-like chemotaxis protein/HPt (histidine-containing phosphotransfer) domain-containing protein